jgi:hypothetical protein
MSSTSSPFDDGQAAAAVDEDEEMLIEDEDVEVPTPIRCSKKTFSPVVSSNHYKYQPG